MWGEGGERLRGAAAAEARVACDAASKQVRCKRRTRIGCHDAEQGRRQRGVGEIDEHQHVEAVVIITGRADVHAVHSGQRIRRAAVENGGKVGRGEDLAQIPCQRVGSGGCTARQRGAQRVSAGERTDGLGVDVVIAGIVRVGET